MATFFWIGTDSSSPVGEWGGAANWSLTEGGSAGSSTPSSSDTVIVPASATQNITYLESTASCAIYIQLGSYGILLPAMDSAVLTCDLAIFKNAGSALNGNSYITGACVFMGSTSNYGITTGDCMFLGSSCSNTSSGWLDGNCLFANGSQNQGYITGNGYFAGGADNSGSITGTATFNGYDASGSTNTGSVTGLILNLPENLSNSNPNVRPLDILGAGI